MSGGSWLSLQRVPPTCGSQGCLGGGESAAKRDPGTFVALGSPSQRGNRGGNIVPFWGGNEKGRTGGAWGGDAVIWGRSVTGGGVALAEGQVRGGWGGHSPKMPEDSWMGGLKNSKNWKYGCEVFEIEKKISFL